MTPNMVSMSLLSAVPTLTIWFPVWKSGPKQQNLSVRQVTNSTCSGVPGMDRPDYRRVQMCRDYHEEP